ncbi:MAG: hypothetical protein FWD58_11315 [Firmicutes bacterium]|nr:hypothetical protein [Bacillota bacterium]
MLRDFGANIAPFNENATFKVNINGLTAKVNESISNACLEVAKEGDKRSCEFLILVNIKTGEWDYQEKGMENAVGGHDFFDFLANTNNKYAFVHNHPSGMTFSFDDLQTFLVIDSIDVMVASGHNGKIFYIKGKKRKIKNKRPGGIQLRGKGPDRNN